MTVATRRELDGLAATREALRALEERYPWRRAEVDGMLWRWMDTGGAGRPLALVPGAVGDGAMFGSTLHSLGERMRLLAVSYPDSADPSALASGFAALVRSQGWQGLALASSSYGAYWAQCLARNHRTLLGALLIGNTFTEAADVFDDPAEQARHLRAATGPQVHAQWLARVRAAPASPLRDLQEVMLAERQDQDSLRQRLLGVAQARPLGPMVLSGFPVITLACADDPLIPERGRLAVERAWPQARHVRLERGGHYPSLLAPGAYEPLLLEIAQ